MVHPSCRILSVVSLVAAVTSATLAAPPEPGVASEQELLDIGIRVFDPGTGGREPEVLAASGIFRNVRAAEARYMAVHLMRTLQASGQWGTVRIVPEDASPLDLTVSGAIVRSNGAQLRLDLEAVDAGGRRWLDRKYDEKANPWSNEGLSGAEEEPYQDLYDEIAADLLRLRDRLDREEIRRVREVAELRFAARLVPDAFDDYVQVNRKGKVKLKHLPAHDDPILAQVAEIRAREQFYLDMLTQHYEAFYTDIGEAYDHYRALLFGELVMIQRLNYELTLQGSDLFGQTPDFPTPPGTAARDPWAMQRQARYEAAIARHREALREIGTMFDEEVEDELETLRRGTARLVGSVTPQYSQWQKLLAELYEAETGLPGS